MLFELSELTEEEFSAEGVFKDIIDALWESYEHPPTRLLNLFYPIQGDGPEAHAARIKDSCIRQLHDHQKNPSSHWIKIVDTGTGEIAAAAQWFIFEQNPYASDYDEEITWWPEGEERDFATALFIQFLTPRMTYMQKPHMHLEICFTRPKYRRQGLGRLLMDWGIQSADKLGFESYIDASEMGAILYEKCGFVSPGWVHIKAPENSEPSARWKELKEMWLPLEFMPQWRPVGGNFDNTKKPWENAG